MVSSAARRALQSTPMPFSPSDFVWWMWLLISIGIGFVGAVAGLAAAGSKSLKVSVRRTGCDRRVGVCSYLVDRSHPIRKMGLGRLTAIHYAEEPNESVKALIEKRNALLRLQEAIEKRIAGVSKEEQREIDALVKRSFDPKCAFDRKHTELLYTLALTPQTVGWYWKLRERIHRVVHHH